MKIAISELGPHLDGSYDFDYEHFTNRELRLIKREANVRAGEIGEALQAGDNDLLVCFALIALARAGKEIEPAMLWDADAGALEVDMSDEEAAASPPAPTPDSDESASESPPSSSLSSNGVGEPIPENGIQSGIGSLG